MDLSMNLSKKHFLFLYLLLIFSQDKYNFYYPTLPIYPNNYQEIEVVKKEINSRSQKDIDDFQKTDKSVCYLFSDYTSETTEELRLITNNTKIRYFIQFFKNIINRARPYQIDSTINDLKSITSHTPAYPAGHAFQAYYLARVLSIKYPDKTYLWDKIAERCDLVRVRAGLHYPSDGQFSKQLVNYFFDFLYDSK